MKLPITFEHHEFAQAIINKARAVHVSDYPGAKFFEEFIVLEPVVKCVGIRVVQSNEENRPLGVAGRKDLLLVEPVALLRCFKHITLKASPQKPVKVFTTLQKLGR